MISVYNRSFIELRSVIIVLLVILTCCTWYRLRVLPQRSLAWPHGNVTGVLFLVTAGDDLYHSTGGIPALPRIRICRSRRSRYTDIFCGPHTCTQLLGPGKCRHSGRGMGRTAMASDQPHAR